jgi:hypothetical protein
MSLEGRVHAHPGALTSTFVAAKLPEGPRVLRVALSLGGKIVDERRFDAGTRVTIGDRADASFTCSFGERLATSSAPKSDLFRLFEVVPDGARLRVPRGARGRAQTKNGIVELASLGGEALELDGHARGIVILGDVTFLFAFETKRAVVRPALPMSVRRGIELDAQTFIVAALSFLAHFAALGALYSDWADPLFDDDVTVTALVEAVRDLPTARPDVEEAKDATTATDKVAETKVASDAKPKQGARAEGAAPRAASRSGSGPAKMSDTTAASLSREMASLDVEMQGVLNPTGASTDVVLRDSTLPLGMLNEAAAQDRRVRPGLSLGTSSTTFGTAGKGTLADLGNRGDGDGGVRGDGKKTDGPDGKKQPPKDPPPTNGGVPGAEVVIAKMSGAFHRCYQNGLDREDPNMEGSVRVLTRVGPNGEVTGASPTVSGNLSGTVVSCIQRKIMGAQFSPPTGGGAASLMIPISLGHQ